MGGRPWGMPGLVLTAQLPQSGHRVSQDLCLVYLPSKVLFVATRLSKSGPVLKPAPGSWWGMAGQGQGASSTGQKASCLLSWLSLLCPGRHSHCTAPSLETHCEMTVCFPEPFLGNRHFK